MGHTEVSSTKRLRVRKYVECPKKRLPPFDPHKPPYRDTTLARQVARQNLTTLNNAFWVVERSFPVTKGAFPSLTFPTILKHTEFPGPRINGKQL